MHNSDLLELGFTTDESRVYIAMLELGGSYVSAIAKKSKVHRVLCYKVLDSLVAKGLVSRFTKNNVQHFVVKNPEILVQKQEAKLQHARMVLPELFSLMNTLAYKPKIEYYEGEEGVKNIFENILTAKGEILGYTNLMQLEQLFPEVYLRDWIRRKVAKKIKSRMLSPLSKSSLRHVDTYYPPHFDRNLVEILHINPDQFGFKYEITIYDTKVAIVSLSRDEMIGLIIESPLYTETQRAIFQLAWLGATSFVAK